MSNLSIVNVRLPSPSQQLGDQGNEYEGTWTVECRGGQVIEVSQTGKSNIESPIAEDIQVLDAGGSIMLPSLCHSHIHLDKCFILDRCGDLVEGNLKEAMAVTAKVKQGFSMNPNDLYQRGARLIEESVENGVTSMRAHVEVDSIVGFSCLDVALKLKDQYKEICDVQIAVFAQEALFGNASDTEPGDNYSILYQAAKREGVSAVGSAPYTEPTREQAKKNIKLIFDAATTSFGSSAVSSSTAMLHVDFHLDFSSDSAAEPLIHEVVSQTRAWYRLCGFDSVPQRNIFRPRVTVGHATRLVLFSGAEWRALSAAIGDLPITIVGLPQTDMYLQGRAHADPQQLMGLPRSVLHVPLIEKEYGMKVAMAVNNIDNAFTPQGSSDPLSSLVTFGVAIFQAVSQRDIRILIEAVTLTSKLAIGLMASGSVPATALESPKDGKGNSDMQGRQTSHRSLSPIPADLFPTHGDSADFVILHGNKNLQSVALHPAFERTTIKGGRIVARRGMWRWLLGSAIEASLRPDGQ